MDEVDKASKTEAFLLQNSIEASRKNRELPPNYTGFCHYCDEQLPKGLLFCDKDCAADYEWHKNLKKQKIL